MHEISMRMQRNSFTDGLNMLINKYIECKCDFILAIAEELCYATDNERIELVERF